MSKYGSPEKSAFDLAKEYGFVQDGLRENEPITNGDLCDAFLYLCNHFRRIIYKPSENELLKGHRAAHMSFQKCVKYGLIDNPELFADKIDEQGKSDTLCDMVEAFCKRNSITFDFDGVSDIMATKYNILSLRCFDWPLSWESAMEVLVILAKLYARAIVQKFYDLSRACKYYCCTNLLLEVQEMNMLLPSVLLEPIAVLRCITAWPDVSNESVAYTRYHIELQKIFEEYFGYSIEGSFSFSDTIYHYTSLATLEKVAGGSPLRLSNVINLNDPAEGKKLFDFLNSGTVDLSALGITGTPKFDLLNYYVISFNANEQDDLPMWQQYGCDSMGCRLAYKLEQFHYYPVYHVVYDEATVKHFIETLSAYRKKNMNLSDNNLRLLLDSEIRGILTQAAFFYKDKAYQYENEVRVIRYVAPENAKEGQIREGDFFPRLYTESPADMKLDSVLLGPRVSDYLVDHVRLGLKARKIHCKVDRSSIKIR